MNLAWDYGDAAATYAKRPSYCSAVLDECLRDVGGRPGDLACDVGAGTGNLTLALAERGFEVVAVEPNPAMRAIGRRRTLGHPAVRWLGAYGESLCLMDGTCALVTFGSSFNVLDGGRALAEAARVLRPGGSVVLVWNHRRLDDPLQARIEGLIRSKIPGYAYGSRREDHGPVLAASRWFANVRHLAGKVVHRVAIEDCILAWRSHVTLRRQAGHRFEEVLLGIGSLLRASGASHVDVPYTTRLWIARRNPDG